MAAAPAAAPAAAAVADNERIAAQQWAETTFLSLLGLPGGPVPLSAGDARAVLSWCRGGGPASGLEIAEERDLLARSWQELVAPFPGNAAAFEDPARYAVEACRRAAQSYDGALSLAVEAAPALLIPSIWRCAAATGDVARRRLSALVAETLVAADRWATYREPVLKTALREDALSCIVRLQEACLEECAFAEGEEDAVAQRLTGPGARDRRERTRVCRQ